MSGIKCVKCGKEQNDICHRPYSKLSLRSDHPFQPVLEDTVEKLRVTMTTGGFTGCTQDALDCEGKVVWSKPEKSASDVIKINPLDEVLKAIGVVHGKQTEQAWRCIVSSLLTELEKRKSAASTKASEPKREQWWCPTCEKVSVYLHVDFGAYSKTCEWRCACGFSKSATVISGNHPYDDGPYPRPKIGKTEVQEKCTNCTCTSPRDPLYSCDLRNGLYEGLCRCACHFNPAKPDNRKKMEEQLLAIRNELGRHVKLCPEDTTTNGIRNLAQVVILSKDNAAEALKQLNIAKALNVSLEAKLKDARKDAEGWEYKWKVYRDSWVRELGGSLIPKHHEIDALVLTTRKRCVNPLLGHCGTQHWLIEEPSKEQSWTQKPHQRNIGCADWKAIGIDEHAHNAELIQALRKYGKHHYSCRSNRISATRLPCDCGLDEILGNKCSLPK